MKKSIFIYDLYLIIAILKQSVIIILFKNAGIIVKRQTIDLSCIQIVVFVFLQAEERMVHGFLN